MSLALCWLRCSRPGRFKPPWHWLNLMLITKMIVNISSSSALEYSKYKQLLPRGLLPPWRCGTMAPAKPPK